MNDPTPTPAKKGSLPPLTREEILTWPNLFTFMRLLCIPIFVWVLLSKDNRAAAAWMLFILGSTDWVDGYLARKLDQRSDFGALFDPAVDRLLFLVAVPTIMAHGAMPIWIGVALLAREVIVAAGALYLGSKNVEPFAVSWEGKAATFLLLLAVPAFLDVEIGSFIVVRHRQYGWSV